MNGSFSDFDVIQKAINQTYHLLENGDEPYADAVNELKAAKEQYLKALSHKTLIDTYYLKSIME